MLNDDVAGLAADTAGAADWKSSKSSSSTARGAAAGGCSADVVVGGAVIKGAGPDAAGSSSPKSKRSTSGSLGLGGSGFFGVLVGLLLDDDVAVGHRLLIGAACAPP